MKGIFKLKYIIGGLAIVFALIQLKPVDRSHPPFEKEQDMIHVLAPPVEVEQLLRQACYDCHSNQTHYPWYARVAPVSWMIERNVHKGREEVNFSHWGSYRSSRAMHKLEESYKQIQHGHMPVPAYTLLHAHARLETEEKEQLINWFEQKANELMLQMN